GIRDRNVTGVQTCALPIYLINRRILLEAGVIDQDVHSAELIAHGLEHLCNILFVRNVGAISKRSVAVTTQLLDHRLCLVFASDIDRKSTRLNSSHVSISYA